MNCSTCKTHIGEYDAYYPDGTCDMCRSAKQHTHKLGDLIAAKLAEMKTVQGSQSASEDVSEAVTTIHMLSPTEELVLKLEEVLDQNEMLQARVHELEEVLAFYVKEDDGGSRAGKALGRW